MKPCNKKHENIKEKLRLLLNINLFEYKPIKFHKITKTTNNFNCNWQFTWLHCCDCAKTYFICT